MSRWRGGLTPVPLNLGVSNWAVNQQGAIKWTFQGVFGGCGPPPFFGCQNGILDDGVNAFPTKRIFVRNSLHNNFLCDRIPDTTPPGRHPRADTTGVAEVRLKNHNCINDSELWNMTMRSWTRHATCCHHAPRDFPAPASIDGHAHLIPDFLNSTDDMDAAATAHQGNTAKGTLQWLKRKSSVSTWAPRTPSSR